MASTLAALAQISLLGLPLVGARSGVVVAPSGDAYEDALAFFRAAGWLDAHDLLRFFGRA